MKNDINFELSEYIKLLRFKAKLSQEDLANKLNITRQMYQKWEAEPIKLNLVKLIEIGNACNENILIFFNEYVAKCNKEN